MASDPVRTYDRASSVVFLKTDAPFGGLSNMAGGFPLHVESTRIYTSEALYQACRFPHLPEVQRLIIRQTSPMTAKMKSKPHREDSRPDWDRVRIKVMRWCLRMKLAQNWDRFSELLLRTGDRPIVEESRRDDFWGTKPVDKQVLVGMNVLGRLLMELREVVKAQGPAAFHVVEPPDIPKFLFLGQPIGTFSAGDRGARDNVTSTLHVPRQERIERAIGQPELFDNSKLREGPGPAYPTSRTSWDRRLGELKIYPAMKDSGVPWLGQVPEHWQVLPNRTVFGEVRERGHPNADMLSVTVRKGVIRQEALLAGSSKKDSSNPDKSAYKLVRPGDIAYNKMRAWQGAVGVSEYEGIVSPAYVVQRPRDGAAPRYLHYLLRTPAFAKEAERWSYGISSDMWSLRPEHFKMIYSCLPPVPEQAAVVRFLDHANRRIGRYIRAKQKLIKLLEEQKQAIIHRAVTRGLDPNVRLKSSGVEWLGDVPEHWEVVRLGRLLVDGPRNGISPPVAGNGGVESFSISAVRHGLVLVRDRDKKYVVADGVRLTEEYSLLSGDVLLVRGNGNIRLVGKAGLVEEDMPGRVYPDLLMRLRVGSSCVPHFVVALLNSQVGRDQIETSARTAVGTFKVNNQQVRRLWFAWPPAPEQRQILEWLNGHLSDLNDTIRRAHEEFALLGEYRTRLIADVVTGKLDVREAASNLPDETGEREPLDEPEPDSDAEDLDDNEIAEVAAEAEV